MFKIIRTYLLKKLFQEAAAHNMALAIADDTDTNLVATLTEEVTHSDHSKHLKVVTVTIKQEVF